VRTIFEEIGFFEAMRQDADVSRESKRPISWGIVGTGDAAQRFAEGLSYVSESTLRAIWGRNGQATATMAAQNDAQECPDFETLLRSDIDALYIATLPDSHAEYSIAALQAGKHVLCEKPVALDVEELERVLQMAQRCGLLFMEAMKPPFFPLYQRLRRQLEEDPIGPVVYVRAGNAIADVPPEHPSWRSQNGGGALMGIGVYHAFLAADWMGEAQAVQALGRLSAGGVDSFACFQTRHAAGFAQLYCGMDLSGPGDAVLGGTDGYANIHEKWWNPVSATVHYADGRVVALSEPVMGNGFNYETTHFCELIRDGKRESPCMPHERSRHVMRILDRVRTEVGVHFPSMR
jgi:predicted dehydrogenase